MILFVKYRIVIVCIDYVYFYSDIGWLRNYFVIMCYYFENKGVIDVDYIMLKKIDMIDWIVNFERKNEFEM